MPFRGALHHHAHELAVVLDVLRRLALLDAVQRRLRDEHVAALDQLVHVAEEEREQQGADVRAVHVGVGHEDDLAVAQLDGIEVVLADARAQRGDHGADFFVAEHLVVARLFHVEDLALQRQDGLEPPVASLLGGAAGALALHQEQLAAFGLALGAVGQLARQAAAIERALAAGEIARLAGRLARARRLDRLVDDLARHRRVLLEERAQALVDECLHDAGDIGIQLALGLSFKLRLRQLDADHRHQSFAHVVAGQVFLDVLEQAELLAGVVDGARQRGAEARQVRAAVHGVDVVGEAEDVFRVAVVVLQRDLHGHAVALGFHVDGPVVQHRLAFVQVLDEFGDPAGVLEFQPLVLARLGIGGALVGEGDHQALVEERQLAQALRQRVEVVLGDGEDCLVGSEVDLGAALLARAAGFLQFGGGLAVGVALLEGAFIGAPDFQVEFFAERVHAAHAHAVQSAGNFVRRGIELAARVQRGHHHLRRGNFFAVDVHVADGNAAAVIDHGDGVVDVDGDVNPVGVAGQRFVHRVVHHFVHQVMQAELARRSDVHGGALAHRFHAAQHLDGVGGVVAVAAIAGARPLVVLHVRFSVFLFCFRLDCRRGVHILFAGH